MILNEIHCIYEDFFHEKPCIVFTNNDFICNANAKQYDVQLYFHLIDEIIMVELRHNGTVFYRFRCRWLIFLFIDLMFHRKVCNESVKNS